MTIKYRLATALAAAVVVIAAGCASTPAPVDCKLEADALAGIKPPVAGVYLGDWKEGEKLAQNGRGMTWSDPAGSPNGGNCYNCHQIAKAEISYGTLGPSLYNYGKLRGVKDPADPVSAPIVQYTWASSIMPRPTTPVPACRASVTRSC